MLKGVCAFVLSVAPAFAQGTLTITTDKPSYSYGETIEVRLSLANTTDSTFTLYGSTTCFARIGMNEIPFVYMCTSDMKPFTFAPGVKRTWVWLLEPATHGIPDRDGTHVIRGYIAGRSDSVFIQSPKFYGGRLSVGFQSGVSESEIRSLRDSVNATVLSRYIEADSLISETWQIIGKSVDSLATVLRNDARIRRAEVARVLWFVREIVTSVPSDHLRTKYFALHQNYPNPFNATTVISFTLPAGGTRYDVSLRVLNVLGQEVATLVDGEMKAGYYRVQWNADGLPSGVYFYRLEAGSFIETRKMVLVR